MKKSLLLAFILAFVLVPVFSVVPVSRTVGRIQTLPRSGSITAKAMEAVKMEFTPEWFEKYTSGAKALIDYYGDILISSLPLENVIAGEEKDNAVSLYDLDKKILVSFAFGSDGLIHGIKIEKR